jgi:hypothetical protein
MQPFHPSVQCCFFDTRERCPNGSLDVCTAAADSRLIVLLPVDDTKIDLSTSLSSSESLNLCLYTTSYGEGGSATSASSYESMSVSWHVPTWM